MILVLIAFLVLVNGEYTKACIVSSLATTTNASSTTVNALATDVQGGEWELAPTRNPNHNLNAISRDG